MTPSLLTKILLTFLPAVRNTNAVCTLCNLQQSGRLQRGTKGTDNCPPSNEKEKKTSENKIKQGQSDNTDGRILKTSLGSYIACSETKRSNIAVTFKSSRYRSKGGCYPHKYQLSLIDPRDGIVLYTELNDRCDERVVDCRSSEVLST